MISRRVVSAASLFFLWLAPPLSAAKPFPPSPANYVYNEGVVAPETEARLSARLAGLEKQTGHQFLVALFQNLDNENLEDYTNRLFRSWQIGSRKGNDGLLFCVYIKDRRWRVEVGYGLEGTLTDLEAAEIVSREAGPHFKAGDYDAGVWTTIEVLAGKIGGTTESPVQNSPRRRPGKGDIAILAAAAIFLLVIVARWLAAISSDARGVFIGRRGAAADLAADFFSILLRIVFVLLGGGGSSSGGFGGGSSGGGFSGGGGSSGGGGASGSW